MDAVSPSNPNLRVQINQIDYTLAPPGPLDNSTLPMVPVVRIYGPSGSGQKTCVHIHQVYPYFFIEYPGALKARDVKQYTAKLKRSLNHAIAISLRRDPSSSKSRYIRSVLLVKGVHFYGFHSSYSPFLKVLVADPALVSRTVTMMQNGTVMGTRFRIYESHLNYTLQFLSDFGLYGCGWIDLGHVMQRGHDEAQHEASEGPDTHQLFPLSPHFRQSRMSLEIDVAAHQILNRRKLTARDWYHNLEIPGPSLPSEPLVLSVRELWEDERERRRARGLNPSPEIPVDLSEASRGAGAGWASEARWWNEIRKRIERERSSYAPSDDNSQSWEGAVMTTFESIEALWEDEYRTWKPRRAGNSHLPRSEMTEPSTRTGSPLPGDSAEEEVNVDVDVSFLSVEDLQAEEIDDHVLEEDEFGRPLDDSPDEQEVLPEDEYGEDNDDADLAQSDSSGDETIDDDNPFIDKASETNGPGTLELKFPDEIGGAASHSDESDTPTHSPRQGSPERSINPTRRSFIADIGPSQHQSFEPVSQKNLPDQTVTASVIAVSQVSSTEASKSTFRATNTQGNWPLDKLLTLNNNRHIYSLPPPSASQLLDTIEDFGLRRRIYRAPYYSDERDAPPRPREYAGLVYTLKGGDGVSNLEDWVSDLDEPLDTFTHSLAHLGDTGGWEYAGTPPSVKEVRKWLRSEHNNHISHLNHSSRSQIRGPTQANKYGLKTTPPDMRPNGGTIREKQDMTILSLEVFAPSSAGRLPNAVENEVAAVFYTFQTFEDETPTNHVLCVKSAGINSARLRHVQLEVVQTELELINSLVDIIIDLDPDIVTGWDVQNSSWGYLAARADSFGLELQESISRAPARYSTGSLQWDTRHTTTFKVAGRHVLNLWRIMRSDQTLNIYTFENVVFNVLGRRVPKYGPATLARWYHSETPAHAAHLVRYFSSRAAMNLELLNHSEVVTKTAEFARVFGVDFYSVISRGSQFKVESFMFRLAKPESFVLISPSKSDVGKQNAAECIPLIMEPQSALYTSPLVVLDFQSLYPSIMIAYNYCYSTCLGRVVDFQGRNKFGVGELDRPPGLLEKVSEHINVAPNGMMYVKSDVRKGLLSRMLTELLDTRVMVKQAMKGNKHDKVLTRILNARQLGLKYIANVTYGYTSASFSGRMPAVEIADSIVQSGRETLEKAIDLIHETKKWGAEVVYGDTDSMFIYMQGKTKEQAFRIGHEIANAVTALNPAPIKLKFEKVYHPCVLMAKKRYVGFKYENIDDKEPVFEAKGIETVRRDGVSAQQKMTENCLKILFRTQDLTEVKTYCCESWTKLLENRAPVKDFIFAKEVKMGTYSERGAPPPGVAVAAKRTVLDPGDEPQYGDRVPYVIARGDTGSRLVDRAMDPLQFLQNPHAELDATYYISRVLIPPLERIFNLVGADVRQWYNEMPRAKKIEAVSPSKGGPQIVESDRYNINEHFNSSQCLICGDFALQGLCLQCWREPQSTLTGLLNRIRSNERRLVDTHRICASCAGTTLDEAVECQSLDCSWLFARKKAEDRSEFLEFIQELVQALVDENELDLKDMQLLDE